MVEFLYLFPCTVTIYMLKKARDNRDSKMLTNRTVKSITSTTHRGLPGREISPSPFSTISMTEPKLSLLSVTHAGWWRRPRRGRGG